MARPGTEQWRREQAASLLTFGRGSALPGGGFGWLGADGTVEPGAPRPLYVTARMTYAYALAYLDGAGDYARRLAESGIRSLLGEYLDREHGGWYASLDHEGRVADTTKANYAQAHVLLASATAVVAGVPGAQDVLDRATSVIGEHFWSDADGAAVENWDAAFTELEPYRGANSNMHSVEAYLVAGDVTGDPVWHRRALAIADRLIAQQARSYGWRIQEHFDASWQPLPDYNRDRPDDRFRPFGTTPGHSFEWARLLVALEGSLPEPPGWLLDAATGLFDTAVAHGWAADGHPGFVYTLDLDDRPVVRQRLHWVACEAVLAADSLHRRTTEPRFERHAEQWWAHIAEHFLDPVAGGWHQELSPELAPTTTVWSGKPDLYHSYQALLLPSLPLAPSAGTALAGRRAV